VIAALAFCVLASKPLAPFDGAKEAVQSFIRDKGAPGAALAVVKDGRLVYATGVGRADSSGTPFTEKTLCRIASVSKCIVALSILKLVQAGKLSLDDPACNYVGPAGAVDPRLKKITIRNLLQHRSGLKVDYWRDIGLARAANGGRRLTRDDFLRFVWSLGMEGDPGQKFRYENTHYAWLSAIIAKVSGMSAEQFTRESVWKPLGATTPFTVKDRHYRAPNEAEYVDLPDEATAPSIYSEDHGKPLPVPYGGGIDYAIGDDQWTCSVVDLARIAGAISGTGRYASFLTPQLRSEMWAKPSSESSTTNWYGFGIEVTNEGRKDGLYFHHTGGMRGASAIINGRFDGSIFIVVTNAGNVEGNFIADIVQPLHNALEPVSQRHEWPAIDLFPNYR